MIDPNEILEEMYNLVDNDPKLSKSICSSAAEALLCSFVEAMRTSPGTDSYYGPLEWIIVTDDALDGG